jgi:hypothetical protein
VLTDQQLAGGLSYLVVLFPTRAGMERAKGVLQRWLAELRLAWKPSKTRIGHTLESVQEPPAGCDFLGVTVRQLRVGASWSGRHNGKRLGFKTPMREHSRNQATSACVTPPGRHWPGVDAAGADRSAQPSHPRMVELLPAGRLQAGVYGL